MSLTFIFVKRFTFFPTVVAQLKLREHERSKIHIPAASERGFQPAAISFKCFAAGPRQPQ